MFMRNSRLAAQLLGDNAGRRKRVPRPCRQRESPADCCRKMKPKRRAGAMDRDDSKYWGLFENRPAKERTSSNVSEPARNRQRDADSREGWSRLQRAPRPSVSPERVKC